MLLAHLMKKIFKREGPEWEIDNLYQIYTTVNPGLIRVDADEVTYPAHIILRYNIEHALISDKMTLNDLPNVWNDGMFNLLGLTPTDHGNGCMQDIHWSAGLFGYFPTYTLGNMYASQFFEAATNELGDLDAQFSAGRFEALLKWLRDHIHSQGERFSASRLVEVVTGKPLSDEPLMRHLSERFLPLYQGD